MRPDPHRRRAHLPVMTSAARAAPGLVATRARTVRPSALGGRPPATRGRRFAQPRTHATVRSLVIASRAKTSEEASMAIVDATSPATTTVWAEAVRALAAARDAVILAH